MKPAKFLAFLSVIALVLVLSLSVCAADPVVIWDFADETDGTLYDTDGTIIFDSNNVEAAFDSTDTSLTADITGGDPFFKLPSRGDFPAENHFLKVKYCLSGLNNWSTSFYFTTDTVDWSETGHYQGFFDGDDDEWCEQIFDLSECAAWSGTITNIRLDVFDSGEVGQVAKIAYVAVFATQEDAEAFDYEAYRASATPAGTVGQTISQDEESPAEEAAPEPEAAEEAPAEEAAPEPEAAEETPAEEAAPEPEAAEETPAEEAAPEPEAAEETPAEEAEAVVTEAPQTFDIAVIATIGAAVSAMGYAVARKKK